MQFWWYLCHLKSNDHSIWWICLDIRCSHTPKLCEEYAGSSVAYLFDQKLVLSIAERVSPGEVVWARILSGGHLLNVRMWHSCVSSSVGA